LKNADVVNFIFSETKHFNNTQYIFIEIQEVLNPS